MSVDSENKSNEAITPYTTSIKPKDGVNENIENAPVTPEMVLRLPTITDSTINFSFHIIVN